MVADCEHDHTASEQKEDLSWLFDAERGAVAVNQDEPGTVFVKGTETVYLVRLDPLTCECPGFKFHGRCFHTDQARRPPTKMRAGTCPVCGDDAVSELSFMEDRGYLLQVRCWSSLGDEPTCDWRRAL